MKWCKCLTCNLHILLCTSNNLKVSFSECSAHSSDNKSLYLFKLGVAEMSASRSQGQKQTPVHMLSQSASYPELHPQNVKYRGCRGGPGLIPSTHTAAHNCLQL